MASRNVKPSAPIFDPNEKLQSNTLKRQPNPDWSKSDLLRLLSYFEGELQARDITVAALRAEKSKQLYYQAKYGRFGLGDPFMALQRDSDNTKDNTFDEPAIKAMYDNQLAQLENLIATQRKAQLKMREQLTNSEKRVHKMCAELEDERHKHAQDTAQGDDVTYMLEKERERLKQEIEFEKSQVKKLEKDLRKTVLSLEEERSNSAKQKQVAIMLLKERKQIFDKISLDQQKPNQFDNVISDDNAHHIKGTSDDRLLEASKSMKMEAAMEKQLSEFDIEREQLKSKLAHSEQKSKEQYSVIEMLNKQVEVLAHQLQNVLERSASRESIQSIEMKSSVTSNRVVSPIPSNKPTPKTTKPVLDGRPGLQLSHVRSSVESSSRRHPSSTSQEQYINIQTPAFDNSGSSASVAPGSNVTVVSQSGGKISLQMGHGMASPRKTVQTGRGTPPPLPPNKPVLAYGSPGSKPSPPSKVGITISKDKITVSGASRVPSPKTVQIPVNVVGGQSVPSASRSSSSDESPIRNSGKVCVNAK